MLECCSREMQYVVTKRLQTCTPSGCTTRIGGSRAGFRGPSDGATLLSATSGVSAASRLTSACPQSKWWLQGGMRAVAARPWKTCT